MDLRNNPFYLLGASVKDNRRRIVELAEEKSFSLDSDICSEARTILTNPQRRVSAEVKWLLDLDDSEIENIFELLNDENVGEDKSQYDFSGYSSLNQLLIKLSFLGRTDFLDIYETKFLILTISRLFENIDIYEVFDIINSNREISGFPKLEKVNEIENVVREIRDDIKHDIAFRLDNLHDDSYVQLVTMLAEAYTEKYKGNIILEDLIEAYSLNKSALIDEKKEEILEMIEFAKSGITEIDINHTIDDLWSLVQSWDKIMQPIQLMNQEQGIDEANSLEVAKRIREFSIFLHNDHMETDASLRLVDLLRECFSELTIFSDKVEEDSEILKSIKEQTEQLESAKPLLEEFKAIETIAEDLKRCPTYPKMNNLIREISQLNDDINNSNLGFDVATDLRLNLCLIGRNVAICINNESGQTDMAQKISQELLNCFGNIPKVRKLISDDLHQLTVMNKAAKEERKSKYIGWVIVIAIMIIVSSLGSCDSSTNTSYNGSSSSSITQSQKDRKAEIEEQLDKMKTQIEGMEDDLNDLLSDLDYYAKLCDKTNNTNADYVNKYNEIVDKYTELYEKYDKKIKKYNELVNEYNSL